MSKEFDPINDPNSHLSRYLAFFQLPGINPDCIREEVVRKFENPSLNLREADVLLREETVGRVEKAVKGVGEKMARNGVSGAHPLKYPESSLYGKPAPIVVGGRLPGRMSNVNKAFGMMAGMPRGAMTSQDLLPKPVQKTIQEFIGESLDLRREAKRNLNIGTVGHLDYSETQLSKDVRRVVAHDPGTKNFVVADLEGDQLRIAEILENHDRAWAMHFAEKRLAEYDNDPFAACYSWGRRTGKTRLEMTVWEAIEKGCFFADTWVKPLYWAMYRRAPSIR